METDVKVYNIYFDQHLGAVFMEWNGYATSAQFREGTELMLNLLIEHSCSKVLANIENMTLIGLEDQRWLEENFLPRAIRFGFKTISIVMPRAYFNRVAIESISYKVDKEKLTISYFDDFDKARASILSSN